ncbi:hypothetical protein HZC53_00150 [Candidatus Uhrbacteria bacterium]|nr:hypothetical protein [Candidatus Uhrbacteria bacterium]
MFAVQEELAGMSGQFVMLVDYVKIGPSRRRMRRGPLTGDCLTFHHVEKTSEATLSVANLTDDKLRLATTEDSGLYTGKVAMGKAPDGPISVLDAQITFEALQYWILFGSDGGRSEFDDGRTNRLRVIEVVTGGANIIRWITHCFSDRIRHHHKREWLEFVVKLMRTVEGGPRASHKDESAWIACLQGLGVRESSLSVRDLSPKTIRDLREELREHLQRAELLGHGNDPYVLDLKRRYPDLI